MIEVLPDPNNKIDATGLNNPTGDPGPGFASVRLSSNQQIMSNRTNSGRLVLSTVASQYWDISISYNPMLREQFDIIYSFLLRKRGGLIPFQVSLPQYLRPKDSALVNNPVTTALVDAFQSSIPYYVSAGTPKIGDLFTVEDPNDSAHSKAYIVTGVIGGSIHCSPPLSKEVSAGATLRFIDPLIRVVFSGDVEEYSLNVNNLFSFSLKLEEAQA